MRTVLLTLDYYDDDVVVLGITSTYDRTHVTQRWLVSCAARATAGLDYTTLRYATLLPRGTEYCVAMAAAA